jgi:hypothetical protein
MSYFFDYVSVVLHSRCFNPFNSTAHLSVYLQRRLFTIIYKDTHRKNFKLITMGVFVFFCILKWVSSLASWMA